MKQVTAKKKSLKEQLIEEAELGGYYDDVLTDYVFDSLKSKFKEAKLKISDSELRDLIPEVIEDELSETVSIDTKDNDDGDSVVTARGKQQAERFAKATEKLIEKLYKEKFKMKK